MSLIYPGSFAPHLGAAWGAFVPLTKCITGLRYRRVGIAGRGHAKQMAVGAECASRVVEPAATPTVVELVM
jgi:hypothetical protein